MKKLPKMNEVFSIREEGDADWEKSLGDLPGQKLAQQKQAAQAQSQAQKKSFGLNRKNVIAGRAQASAGGTKPLTRPSTSLQDPGMTVKDTLGKQPMNRMDLLKSLHGAIGNDRTFDPKQALANLNQKHPAFKFDDYLNKVATMGPDKKWKLK